MTNEEITARLMEPFPAECIRTRPGRGGIALSYVSGGHVLKRLIEATDNTFDFRVLDVQERDDMVIAICELEIPGLGKRQHIGCARRDSDQAFKIAVTDSLKKILSLYGNSLSLYLGEDDLDTGVDTPDESRQTRNGYSGRGNGERASSRPNFRPIRQTA